MTTTLLHVFPSFAIGGQQARFATIANCLGEAFRHRLVSLDGRDEAISLLSPAINFELLTSSRPVSRPIQRMREIARVSRETKADVVITYNWGSIEWAIVNYLYCRRPHVHFEDGFGSDEADRQKARRVFVRHLTLKRSIVVVPSYKLEEIARTLWKLKPQTVRYIPNGIDPARFDRPVRDGAPHFRRSAEERIIGSFSPLRPEKNIARLIRGFAELAATQSSVRLIICGDGPQRDALRGLVNTLGVARKVVFAGHINRPEEVMGAFDLFAMTSDTEQMPYAVLEAMAARRPIVSTAVGDISSMVAQENRRFIVERDDQRQLVQALGHLTDDETLCRRLGNANRRRVEKSFAIAPMVDAFRRTLASVGVTER